MKLKFYALLVLTIFSSQIFSQGETKRWYFGNYGGLDFTSGTPSVVTTGTLNTEEGSAVASNSVGGLLFYTDGITVYNSSHSVMPNGTGLNGDISTTQSALIVKKPSSTGIYYIFTLPAEGTGNFCYSVVDMSLDGGNGDVTTKNTVLMGNVTEKLSAVHHCNGTDIWVMVHGFGNNQFAAYKISAAGVATAAVTSSVGPAHTDVHGYMKFSHDGTKIACNRDTVITPAPFVGKAYLELAAFNASTGVVSSPTVILLNNWQKSYGIEFSPNDSRIYTTDYDINGLNGDVSNVIQYDMTAPNISSTSYTVTTLIGGGPDILRALQLGSDGKIYVAKSGTPFLSVINSPNSLGVAASFSADVLNIDPNSFGNNIRLGLPNFVQSYLNPAFPAITTCTTSTPTAIHENSGTKPQVYFDNSSDKLVMTTLLSDEGNYSLKVFNAIGELSYESKFDTKGSQSEKYEFKMPPLAPGVYILQVNGGGISQQTKFLKQ
jgi:hypothetical protein